MFIGFIHGFAYQSNFSNLIEIFFKKVIDYIILSWYINKRRRDNNETLLKE